MYNPAKEDEKKAVEECVEAMMQQALVFEGTVSVSTSLALGKCILQPAHALNRANMGSGLEKRQETKFSNVNTRFFELTDQQECLVKELGPATISVMKALKETLDPQSVKLGAYNLIT